MASGTELTHAAPTAGEYIAHHLTFLNNSGEMQANLIDFGLYNVDTLFYSIVLGLLSWLIGVLLRPIGNVLYLIPPYCISAAQLQQIYAHIRDFLQTDGSADLNIV